MITHLLNKRVLAVPLHEPRRTVNVPGGVFQFRRMEDLLGWPIKKVRKPISSLRSISVARWLIFRPIWPKVAYFQVDWLKNIKSSRPIEKWLIWLILSGN